jgi:hypothetical protein
VTKSLLETLSPPPPDRLCKDLIAGNDDGPCGGQNILCDPTGVCTPSTKGVNGIDVFECDPEGCQACKNSCGNGGSGGTGGSRSGVGVIPGSEGSKGHWNDTQIQVLVGHLKNSFPHSNEFQIGKSYYKVDYDVVVNCVANKISKKYSFSQTELDHDDHENDSKMLNKIKNIIKVCVLSNSSGMTSNTDSTTGTGTGNCKEILPMYTIVGIVSGSLLIIGCLIALYMENKRKKRTLM